jgi:flavin reductase (DIM6/NTAB) family NADH-FMN oxidoreductase RutF
VARRADAVAIHAPDEGAQALAELFGGETGDEIDKFERCDWSGGPRGLPILAGVDAWFTARVIDELDLGDHAGLVTEPEETRRGAALRPLRLHAASRIDPGHEA